MRHTRPATQTGPGAGRGVARDQGVGQGAGLSAGLGERRPDAQASRLRIRISVSARVGRLGEGAAITMNAAAAAAAARHRRREPGGGQVRRLHRHAQAGARRRLAAGIAGAGADDLPAASGARQRVQRQPARDAGLAQRISGSGASGSSGRPSLACHSSASLCSVWRAGRRAGAADHHVQRVVVQQLVQLAGDADADVQLDLGMRQPEGGQHVGQGPSARSSEVPSRTRPRSRGASNRRSARSWASRMMRACTSRLRPSLVSASVWVSRTNNRRFSACSSWRTCSLTVGWVRPSRRAASVKLGAAARRRRS